MKRSVRHLIVPVAVATVLVCAPVAAASPTAVLRACLNEQSLDGFSDADKRAALNQMPADAEEYSDCRSVIGASIGSGGGKVTAGVSTAGKPGVAGVRSRRSARRAAARKQVRVREARRKRARTVREKELGERAVDPRDPGVFRAAGTANGMPLPLLLAVGALGLLATAAGLVVLSRRRPGVLRRVSLPRFRR